MQSKKYEVINYELGVVGGDRVASVNSECISTNEFFSGVLTITEFDLQNQTVSGTFWMNLQHPISGETVRINDGRFDTRFGL